MAEVAPLIRTRSQLAAIASLRWRLMLNSVRTTRGKLELLSQIFTGFWFLVMGVGTLAGCAVAGWIAVAQAKFVVLTLLLWVLFGFWQLFPLMASVFMEHGDASQLTRYPLSFRAYILVRVAFGAFDVSTLLGGCALAGLVIGVGIARPALLPAALAAVLLFGAFNIALSQMVFAWLEHWLARRRTREIVAVVFFLLLFGLNFIGPLTRHGVNLPARSFFPYATWLPPSLGAHLIASSAAGRGLLALGIACALALWSAAVVALLAARLRTEFRGEVITESAPPRRARKPAHAAAAAYTGPAWLAGPAAAVAYKELRYLLRSPMMLYTFAMPIAILVLFRFEGMGTTGRHAHAVGIASTSLAAWGFPIGVAYALLILTNLVFNALGTDASGVQFYFMAPARFREILMGKNIAYGLVFALEVLAVYVAAVFIDGAPSPAMLLATLAGLVFAVLADFACGNVLSLTMPKKIDLSRLGRQSARGSSALLAMALQGALLAMIAIAVGAGWLFHRPWITALLLASLIAAGAGAYFLVLDRSDALALARREVLIAELSKA